MGLYPTDVHYLDNTDFVDPKNNLAVGAVDDKGIKAAFTPQTSWDGYVLAAQEDLWSFGIREDYVPGMFDAQTRLMVLRFQRASMREERARQEEPVAITFVGGPTGAVDGPTRDEIRIWKENGYRIPRPGLAERAAAEIFSFTAQEETGCKVEDDLVHRKNVDGEMMPYFVPGAFRFKEEHKKNGLRVGLLGYSQISGWLGRLLKKTYRVDPALLEYGWGSDYRELYNLTNRSTPKARMAEKLEADDKWFEFLRHPQVRKIQLYLAWDDLLKPLYEVAENNRIRTIKGLAFLCDIAYKTEVDDAIITADACGPRDLAQPAEEHLRIGLLTISRLLPPGQTALVERFERILDSDLEAEVEYSWNLRLSLREKFPESPEKV